MSDDLYRNAEGYYDPTAGAALTRHGREERGRNGRHGSRVKSGIRETEKEIREAGR